VLSEIDLDQDTRLTFEVSDGVRAIELYRALAIETEDGVVRVSLGNVPASCKPRDRWLKEAAQSSPSRCCTPALEKVGRFG
jgi:hypothetical protein